MLKPEFSNILFFDFYSKGSTQTVELNKQLEDAKQKVKSLYERWEELEKIKSLL